jgi:hypothetical protein
MSVCCVMRPGGRRGAVLSQVPLQVLVRASGLALTIMAAAPSVRAQSMDDAIFMDKRVLCAGLVYTREHWNEYWEGTSKRANGNIGTLTTTQATWMAAYGATNRINILASLPFVWTKTSQGVLAGQRGAQDLSIGIKVRAFSTPLTTHGTLHGIAVVSATAPMSDYTVDFFPLSIGSASKRATVRGMLSFQARNGIYVNGSAAYTRRGNVTIDRVAYFTNNQLFLTNEAWASAQGTRRTDRLHTSDDARRWRHPAAGYAVRIESHGFYPR